MLQKSHNHRIWYEPSYIKYGFTVASKNGRDVPKCVLCLEILANESLKPSKRERHLKQKHPAEANKSIDFVKRKEEHLAMQPATFKQQASVPERALKACVHPIYFPGQLW